MSATRILWGQILIVFAIALLAVWTATEWTAWHLAFQPQLGRAWFWLGGLRIYAPPAFFWWWFAYDAYAPHIFGRGALIAASGGLLAFGVAIALSVWRAREAKTVATYGSARWASRDEVRKAGLLGPRGVVLGALGGEYLRHDGPEHVLCFAPTRSGKGVGLVVPSLLTWPASAIVHDIKACSQQPVILTLGRPGPAEARRARRIQMKPSNNLRGHANAALVIGAKGASPLAELILTEGLRHGV